MRKITLTSEVSGTVWPVSGHCCLTLFVSENKIKSSEHSISTSILSNLFKFLIS